MLTLGPQAIGTDRDYGLLIQDSSFNAVTGFTGAEALSAKLWLGDDQAPLATPAVAWVDASAAKTKLTVAASDIALLTAGTYRLRCLVVTGGRTKDFFEGAIRLLAAPGSALALPIYCTLEDMQDLAAGWVDSLMRLDKGQTNFARHRALARKWLDRQVMARAREILEDQMRRHGVVGTPSDPIIPTTGYDAGPGYGPSTIPNTTLRDQLSAYQGYLVANQLMTGSTLDNGSAAEIAAHYALFLACDGQIGATTNETPYQVLARKHRRRAIALLASWTARIDTNADSVADFELDA